jgi:hypothetical protein
MRIVGEIVITYNSYFEMLTHNLKVKKSRSNERL